MRMLCIAAQHDPIGYVSINSVGLTPEGIARIVGAQVPEVEQLIGELSRNGVFSRDRNGTIYNRRMVRDAKKSAIARKNGKLGGNPTLCKTTENIASDKGMVIIVDKAMDKLKPIPIPVGSLDPDPCPTFQIENPSTVLPVRKERANGVSQKPKRNSYPDEFEAFWKGYPTDANMSKVEAFDVWKRIPAEEREEAIKSLPAFRGYCSAHPDYRPVHANRYLAKKRFEGHLQAASDCAEKAGAYVKIGTPQWDAWSDHYQRTKGRSPPADAKGGWHFPTEFPPVLEAAQ